MIHIFQKPDNLKYHLALNQKNAIGLDYYFFLIFQFSPKSQYLSKKHLFHLSELELSIFIIKMISFK